MEAVQMMNTAPLDKPEEVKVETVDLNSRTKDELIKLVEMHKSASENYENTIETERKKHEEELKHMSDYYAQKLKEKNAILDYYERKFKVLNDILNIETGGRKDD